MKSILFLAVCFLCCFQSIEAQTYHYQINPIEAVDRTNLENSLKFETEKTNPIPVKLPKDCFGSPNLHRFVTSFTRENKTVIKDGEDVGERIVQPNQKGEIHLKNRISKSE